MDVDEMIPIVKEYLTDCNDAIIDIIIKNQHHHKFNIRQSEVNFDLFTFIENSFHWRIHEFGFYYILNTHPYINAKQIIMNDTDENALRIYNNYIGSKLMAG